MDGTVGEIRLFAGSFAPRSWAFCQAQTIQVRANTALYSIIGIMYGGDGTTTFKLPDFAGRVAVGVGQENGLSLYAPGQQGGTIAVTLAASDIPVHTHLATPTLASQGSGTATLNAVNGATLSTPGGNYIGTDSNTNFFSNVTPAAPAPMASASLEVSNVVAPQITSVTLSAIGGNTPHNNLQPYLVMNFIICMFGVYPSRN
ncbi:phage tail protein [Filimonas effusa]|uniref:Phage tail protein n=1 Tax=Filimonas effusa TaxID=2508721 RepID=A0A4Q1D9B6_9BACT|nr:tail fiber protein [Filimonas effusa]RXK85967.1 phage tail protein [Filimonas effusa]